LEAESLLAGAIGGAASMVCYCYLPKIRRREKNLYDSIEEIIKSEGISENLLGLCHNYKEAKKYCELIAEDLGMLNHLHDALNRKLDNYGADFSDSS
jgi:hypothetical protein